MDEKWKSLESLMGGQTIESADFQEVLPHLPDSQTLVVSLKELKFTLPKS